MKIPIEKARIIKVLATAALLAALALAFSGCDGGLSGTYYVTGMDTAQFRGEKTQSIEFQSFDNAEMVTYSLGGTTTWKDCIYSINCSKITIRAKWGYTDKHEESYSYRQQGGSIFIDGKEYTSAYGGRGQ